MGNVGEHNFFFYCYFFKKDGSRALLFQHNEQTASDRAELCITDTPVALWHDTHDLKGRGKCV